MAKKIYKTARGAEINIDSLRLQNETVIAVGNMKVNARGDELGAGGQIVRTRNQVLRDRDRLHTMVPTADPVYETLADALAAQEELDSQDPANLDNRASSEPVAETSEPEAQEEAPEPTEVEPTQSVRGSLASAVTKQTTVKTTPVRNTKQTGLKRI
jgi:hypothetical protein